VITITRSLARRVRAVFCKALGLRGRGLATPLLMEAGPAGLRLRASAADVAIEYCHPGSWPTERAVVPVELLADCEGRAAAPVEVHSERDSIVVARWDDGDVPQVCRYHVPEGPEAKPFPELPRRLAANPPGIVAALQQAAETTDPHSQRYAIGCIELRGRDGSLRATDGRQLLIQTGYAFPWKEDLLIPVTRAFACKELRQDEAVQLARTEDWVTLVIGTWTLHLRIDKLGRFPELDHVIPRETAVTTRLRIDRGDAAYLATALPKLPCDNVYNDPVTLDLNGSVTLRARGPEDTAQVDVGLTRSVYTGPPIRLALNRQYLARALQLGFNELQFVSAQAPMLGRDTQRVYVWAVLAPDAIIKPSADAIRLTSPSTVATSRCSTLGQQGVGKSRAAATVCP